VVSAYLRDVPRGVVSTRLVGSTWGVPLDEDRVKKDIAQAARGRTVQVAPGLLPGRDR
jgi:hypothetical protein